AEGEREVLAALGRWHAHGGEVDWDAVRPLADPVPADLPTYAFNHRRFWLDAVAQPASRPAGHPLLATAIPYGGGSGTVLTGGIGLTAQPWLADHVVAGQTLFPGSGFVDLVAHAALLAGCDTIVELTLAAPLPLPASDSVPLQVTVGELGADGQRTVRLHTRSGEEWTEHGRAVVATSDNPAPEVEFPDGGVPHDTGALYARLADRGYDYGPMFRALRAVRETGGNLVAEVELPAGDAGGFGLHPVLLDAAMHALAAVTEDGDEVLLPFSWNGIRVFATGARALRVRLTRRNDGSVGAFFTDLTGRPVAEIASLVFRPLPAAPAAGPPLRRLDWVEHTGPAAEPFTGTVERFAPGESVTGAVARALELCRGEQERAFVTVGVDRDPAAAAVWGLVRSAQLEQPGRFRLIDAEAGTGDLGLALAVGEPQLAVRGDRLLTPRLIPVEPDAGLEQPAGSATWRLDIKERGTLENLVFVDNPAARAPLRAGEVRVSVRAAGVNFRDVLNALGMYPGKAGPLSIEAAGVVLETGPGVTGLAPGDRVMGLMPGASGPVVVTDRRYLTPVPAGWTFAEAASVPVGFCTAWYALIDLAGLRAGESVLVHSGAGGVGMMALQLARHWGAEAYATASPPKWPALRATGLDDDHLASSRTLAFEEKFRGRIDVVLNCLAGEFVDASLRVLRGGRFVEMGKTDLRDPDRVAHEHPGVHYRAFDVIDAGPDRIAEILAELTVLASRGTVRPLPITTWDLRQARSAYRYLSQARQVGKVVLTVPAPLDPDGVTLVTGGTGALGTALAHHLAEARGHRRLLLAGRRGELDPQVARSLREAGAEVTVAACDVGDPEALAELIGSLPHPLTAVYHLAGFADDGVLEAQDAARSEAVLRAKAGAALHLHELTAELDLAEFVLYSSASGLFGSPGQTTYAAANAALDAVARLRRSRGLPALTVDWGLWAPSELTSGITGALRDLDFDRMA
ncbi:MAG TPA: SDR family NAD(P)-dependent oxidoreductase, partial [Actinoplanes sp.]|nr:SDR family NAD(P)-dependent oxidoreductase [Actinoplanes sp.]